MRIRLYQKTEDNLFYFQFLTKDDQLILDSQGYQSKDGRNNGVNSVKTNAAIAERYETHSEGGQYYFILKAANQQEIARSPMFASEEEMADAMNLLYTKAGGKDTPPAKTTGNDKTYAGKKGDDNYRPLAVYEQHTKNVENGFGTFADDDGHYYFAYNVGGKTILLSESYTSASGRNNGVESVTKNMVIADRYVRKVHPNGKHYFNLLAGNKQEIATSRWFDSEAEMEAAIASLMSGGTGATYVPREGYKADVPIDGPEETKDVPKEKKPRKKRAKSAKPKGEKVILKEGNYLFNDVTYHTMRSANEKYYFSFKSPEGKTVLLSANVRGYNTEEEVDAAVQRVMEFAPHEVNYEGKTTKNGKYYFYLNDRDGNRVAKSFFFNTTDEMQSAIGLFVGDLTVGDPTPAPKKEAKVDDYLPCGDYEGGVWFHTFFRGDREEYFFAFNSPDGKTYLRSEGYTTEKARDNGIESVKKNAPIEARWTTGTAMNDKYHYYALKAGNHQEIARSCYYSSKEEMEEAFSWVRGEQSILGEGAQYVDGQWWTAYMLRMKAEEEAAAAKKEEEKKAAAAKAASMQAAAPAPKKEAKVDDYLPCGDYSGGEWFHTFYRDDRKEYYFAFNSPDGKTYLRSEGYTTEKARDNGIESVKKNAPIEARWTTGTAMNDKYYYYALKAGNHQEIARSCYYGSKEEMEAAFAWVRGEQSILGEGAQYVDGRWWTAYMFRMKAEEEASAAKKEELKLAAAAKKAEEAKPVDKEDDYLPCKAYQGHPVNDKINNVAFFKHENGQFYFVMYDANGDVKLRSEGFRTSAERDQELSGVVRLHNKPEFYSKIEKAGHYMDVLKDETGREVGRSCLKKVVSAAEIAKKEEEEKKAAAAAAAAAALALKQKEEAEALRKAEAEAEAKRKAEAEAEAARLKAEAEAKRKAEAEAARLKAEAEAKRKAEAEAARLKAEEEKKAAATKAAAAAAAASAAAALFWKKEVKDSDFMHCNEYKGHQVNDKLNRVAFFKRNGKFYFAVYDTGGNVKLRSEGFDTVENRDAILAAVLKNMKNDERYYKREQGDHFWNVLKDESGRVLAWSCAEKKKAAVVAPAAAVTTAAATAATTAATTTKEVVKEERKGGIPWWLWLLLGLLALGLIGYFKGCFGCNATDTGGAAATTEIKHEETKQEEPAVVQKSEEELAAEKQAEADRLKAEAEAEEKRIIEEKALREREEAEKLTPAVGVDAGFERVNEHK